MTSLKTKILACVFNSIVFIGIIVFCCLGTLTHPAYLVGLFLFSIPFIFSVIYTIFLFLPSKSTSTKLTKVQKFLIVGTVISSIVFLFYFVVCIIGINQSIESINGTIEGYIISETQTQEELLQYMYFRLYSNIYVTVLNMLMFVSNIVSCIFLFKKQNTTQSHHWCHLPLLKYKWMLQLFLMAANAHHSTLKQQLWCCHFLLSYNLMLHLAIHMLKKCYQHACLEQ